MSELLPPSAFVAVEPAPPATAREHMTDEQSELRHRLALAQRRIEALERIQALQEESLGSRQPGQQSEAAVMLARWRSQVYSLLMQRAADEERLCETERVASAQVADAKAALEQARRQIGVLEAVVADRDAKIGLLKCTDKREQEELRRLRAEHAHLTAMRELDRASMAELQVSAKRMNQEFEASQAKLQHATTSLGVFVRRLSFASGRLATAQALFREKSERQPQALKSAAETASAEASELVRQLEAEVARLSQERAELQSIVERHAELTIEQVEAVRAAGEAEARALNSQAADLQAQLVAVKAEAARNAQLVASLTQQLEQSKEALFTAQDLHRQQCQTAEADRRAELRSVAAENRRLVADLETALEEARQEAAAAVVCSDKTAIRWAFLLLYTDYRNGFRRHSRPPSVSWLGKEQSGQQRLLRKSTHCRSNWASLNCSFVL
eukprot:m.110242 g.110242  ORF g.110242 m.110242 type:complete len:444 (+) comp9333_c0_seq3:143-1474(+)